jgi:hypothetical protein
MKKLICTLLLSFPAYLFAQLPEHSSKLEKEQGFNILKVGAMLSKVKAVLQRDTLDRSKSLEPKAQTMGWTDRVYLVDLKKPGYAKFCGKNIERIEVWFMHAEEGDDFTITEVKIFFKAVSDKDTKDFFDKVVAAYGMPASYGLDLPEPGMITHTWYSSLVLMGGTSYYGDPVTEEVKTDRIKIEFGTAVGG